MTTDLDHYPAKVRALIVEAFEGEDPGLLDVIQHYHDQGDANTVQALLEEHAPLETLIAWLARVTQSLHPHLPSAVKDLARVANNALREGVALPPQFWRDFEEASHTSSNEGIPEASSSIIVAGRIFPLPIQDNRARGLIHGALSHALAAKYQAQPDHVEDVQRALVGLGVKCLSKTPTS